MGYASNEGKSATYVSEIVQWLEAQSRNEIVAWTSPHIWPEEPFAMGFVDIEVPELLEKLGVMWLWTIVDPHDQDPADELTIVLEKDSDQGWSPEQISRGLEQWVCSHSHRTDIQFRWDPEIPSKMIAVVEEAERQSTTEPNLQIGEGLYASTQAMDALLRMPIDHAAEVTRVMQAVADEHRPDA
jgi:hypothetical protein